MRRYLFCMLPLLLGACSEPPQTVDGHADLAVVSAPETVNVRGTDGAMSAAVLASDRTRLDGLRAALRPIDSPLPTREQLDSADLSSADLVALLDDDDRLVRLNAARVLGGYGDAPEVVKRLVELTEGPDSGLRTAAVEGLGRLPREQRLTLLPVFAKSLGDADHPAAGFAAIEGLRDSAEGQAVLKRQAKAGGHPAVVRRLANVLAQTPH